MAKQTPTPRPIVPQHPSRIGGFGGLCAPIGFGVMRLSTQDRVFIESEAISIYTDMVNAGATLQQTLTAVYLSGMRAANIALDGEGGEAASQQSKPNGAD